MQKLFWKKAIQSVCKEYFNREDAFERGPKNDFIVLFSYLKQKLIITLLVAGKPEYTTIVIDYY